MVGSDRGYVYEGGTSGLGSEADSGFQQSQAYVSNNPYAPFIAVDTAQFVVGTTGVYTFPVGSGPSSLTWACGQSIYLDFTRGNDGSGFDFDNISSTTDFSCTSCQINGIFFSVQYPNGYRDWQPSPNCLNCTMKRVTAIGQVSDQLSDGSSFGPVVWSNASIALSYPYFDGYVHPWSSVSAVEGCFNYPTWTSIPQDFDGCTSSPIGASIQVNYYSEDQETDSIFANGNHIDPHPTPTPRPTPNPPPTKSPPKCPPSSCGGGNAPVAGP